MPFAFHSAQVHHIETNGHKKTKKNIVDISNGKGTKTVELRENGRTRKNTKILSKAEVAKIQKNEFIPGLFKPCYDCLRSPGSQTRRALKKKRSSRR